MASPATPDVETVPSKTVGDTTRNDAASISHISIAKVGRQNLADAVPPHPTYEGAHRWDPTASWSIEEEKRCVRKADLYLMSWLCLMFFGLQLDRGNLSNALADDFLKDLKITTDDYNNGTTIQLICFFTAEFPVQFLTKRYGFKYVLPTMMVFWSTASWAQAFMNDRTSFYLGRAFIGLGEGGFIPSTILFATYFYTSKELAVRLAVFWSTLNVARVASALLAAGILQMRGIAGRPGWFWLFLLEGLFTFLVGVTSYFYLPVSPTHTKGGLWRKSWFTEREEVIMTNRILRDDPAKGLTHIYEPAKWKDVKAAWSDKSMWSLYFIGLVAYIPATPVQAYLTYQLRQFNFTTLQSNMLTVPSAALQIFTMLGLAWSSDYFNERTWHCFFGEAFLFPCLVSMLTLPDGGRTWERYALVTLVSGYPYFHPIVSSWISENSFDVKKRLIAAATYNVIVQFGSMIGSQVYRSYDAPYYKQGNGVGLALCVLSLVVFVGQRFILVRMNKKKAVVWDGMSAEQRLVYQEDKEARENEGNKRLDFRHVY